MKKARKTGDKRGKNPASLANLKPFEKGVSGNPSGRPRLLGESYKAMLARVNETDPQKRTNAELIANAALVAALGGDVSAMREIRAATEGEKTTTLNIDVANLTDEQLERIARGEDARIVIASAGASGTGTTQTPADAAPAEQVAGDPAAPRDT